MHAPASPRWCSAMSVEQAQREACRCFAAVGPLVQQDERRQGRIRRSLKLVIEPNGVGLEVMSVHHQVRARLTEGSKVNRFARHIRRPRSLRGF